MLAGGGVGYIIDCDFGIVFGSVGHFGEFHAIELFGHGEDTVAYGVDSEVFAHFALVEVIFFLTYFLGVIIVIPGCDFEVLAFAVDNSLHFGYFVFNTCHSRLPDLHEKIFGVGDGLGHYIVGHVRTVVFEAEELGFFCAGLKDLVDYRKVVVFAVGSEICIAFVHFAAQVAVVGILQQGQAARGVEREHPVAFAKTAVGGFFGCHGDARCGKTGEFGAVAYRDRERIGCIQQILVESEVKFGKLGIDGLKFLFLLRGEEGAVAGELLVVFLYGAFLIGVESLAVVIYVFDASEKSIVHGHFVGKLRVFGIKCLGDLNHFR